MEKRELELKKKLDAENTAAYLEELATGIRQGEISIEQGTEILQLSPSQDFSLEVKTKVKKEKVKFGLTLSWTVESKERQHDSESTGSGEKRPASKKREKYKTLKKRMSDDFGAIRSSIMRKKAYPDPAVVDRFCIDARAMCTYRKKGEPFYEEFLERIETFDAAFEEQNLRSLQKAFKLLADLKDRCHEEYK
jgi:XXXCH domain-containing protein